jgi:D-alanyl-D-alanine carboxypeptidase
MIRYRSAGWLLLVLAACASATPSAPIEVDASVAGATGTPAVITGSGPELLVAEAAERPAQPPIAPRYPVPLVSDHCVDRDLPAPPAADPTLTILDRTYALAADDVPPDLVQAAMAGLDGTSGTRLIREIVAEDLGRMHEAWRAAGLTIVVDSAYRSYADQAATFDGWAARIGLEDALVRTARPGHSEHQLGTAIDVTSPGWSGRFGDWAAESAEGAWMAEHAWEYGFVMSYPADGQDDTCYGYEPWHYRWIGRDAAADHRASRLPLRRFLERYVGQ